MKKNRKTKKNRSQERKNNDNVESEAETPTKNKHNQQNNKNETEQKGNIILLLQNKMQPWKLSKGTCAQEGKRQEKWNNWPCLLEGEWERKCQLKEKYFGTCCCHF